MARPSEGADPLVVEELRGVSPAIRRIAAEIRRLSRNDSPVLVVGETGTGKELVARLIHLNSARSTNRWLPINCAAIPEPLFESEFFGHERGAFTGADVRREGMFDQAHGGTLFLDEIGEMPPSIQAKFLRVLETGEFQRLGCRHALRRDVRIVAATNRNLEALSNSGSFRLDLLYRIRVGLIIVPPLRERREDILPLAEHFCRAGAARNEIPTPRIGEAVRAALLSCSWKGNVRELRSVIEDMLTHLVEEFELEHLPAWFVHGQCLGSCSTSTERALLLAALERNYWKKQNTAKDLKWSRTKLWRKLREYKIRDR